MDQPITRAEHEEFRRRLEEENSRQDRRIALLEESVSKMGALSTSVEKLALSMESMVKEQEKQGKRLETLESRDGEMWRKGSAVCADCNSRHPSLALCSPRLAFRRCNHESHCLSGQRHICLSKNFTRKDFKCPCGCSRQMVDSELVEKLQAIRDKLGKAIKVTSGYRCLSHNAAVGGSSGSKHRYGMAADWRLVDRSINPVALGIIAAQYFKAVGIYWYDGCAIVHTDTRDAKATWLCDAPAALPQHHLPEVHSADHPPGLHRGCKPYSHEDAPAAAGG